MRFPQVSEKVKEAPANALRAVFARVGQLLLVTDRMKSKSGDSKQTAPEVTATAPATAAGSAATAEAPGAPEATGAAAAEVPAARLSRHRPACGPEAGRQQPAAKKPAATARDRSPAGQPDAARARRGHSAAAEHRPAPAAKQPAATQRRPGWSAADGRRGRGRDLGAASPAVAEVPVVADGTGRRVRAPAGQLRPAHGGLVAGPAARAVGRAGPHADHVRAGRTRNRPDVVAMFERRVAKLESGEAEPARTHGPGDVGRSAGPGPHRPAARRRLGATAGPDLGRR